jgi:hypothetical protein
VSVQEIAKVWIRHSLLVAGLHQAIVDVVSQIVDAEAPRRRRALTHAFDQIHAVFFVYYYYYYVNLIVVSIPFMTLESHKLLSPPEY